MKKVKFVCFGLLTLFLMLLSVVFGAVRVLAYTYNPYRPGSDFTPYKDNIVYCDLTVTDEDTFFVDGWEVYLYIDDLGSLFQFRKNTDFSPEIVSTIVDDRDWSKEGFLNLFGVEEIYWNPWSQYWQIGYPDELEYYKEQYLILTEEINNLLTQKTYLQNTIYELNTQIAVLQSRIRNLEIALELEFVRGYDEGFEEGFEEGYNEGILVNESEAYQEGFRDGEKSKLAENNAAFYTGIEKWLVPGIITVIALGGFVSIAAIKRREQ